MHVNVRCQLPSTDGQTRSPGLVKLEAGVRATAEAGRGGASCFVHNPHNSCIALDDDDFILKAGSMPLGSLSQGKTYNSDMQSLAHFRKIKELKWREGNSKQYLILAVKCVHTTIQSTAASTTDGIPSFGDSSASKCFENELEISLYLCATIPLPLIKLCNAFSTAYYYAVENVFIVSISTKCLSSFNHMLG